MVSTWQINNTHTTFENISSGQFFCMSPAESNHIFIKTDGTVKDSFSKYNAVNLQGELCWFDNQDMVFYISVPYNHTVTEGV